VEEILISIRDTDKTPYGRTLWRAIRQKLEGKAEDAIHTAGAGLNWNEIKDALILFCADKRDEQALMAELYGLAHAQLPIQILFKKIHNIEQDSEKYSQNPQLHNIDEDSNFQQSASRNRQDT